MNANASMVLTTTSINNFETTFIHEPTSPTSPTSTTVTTGTTTQSNVNAIASMVLKTTAINNFKAFDNNGLTTSSAKTFKNGMF
jgi:hypothetical protein